jgi:soluble lytic murein transglycosylase-like protein
MLSIITGLLIALGVSSTTPADIMVPKLADTAQALYDSRPTSTPELIHFWSSVYGVDGDKAVKIARAESGLVCTAKSASSSATGLFQVIKGTKKAFGCEGEMVNCEDNIICAMKILKTSGDHHWDESRAGWQ